MKTLKDLSLDEIAGILNIALDDDEWHTPSVSDINIHAQTVFAIYGWCNLSKHNTYHDIEHWFNINCNNVQIWKVEYDRGKANWNRHRPIYNFKQLGDLLSEYKVEPQNQ